MKSSPLVVIVPLIIALIVITGVVGVKYVTESQQKAVVVIPTPASLPSLQEPTGKPQVGFDNLQNTEPVSDLRKALESTKDTDTSDIDSLQAAASLL